MRIGINCITLKPDYHGGVKSYTLGLIGGFAASESHQFVIFAHEKNQDLFKSFKRKNISLEIVYGYDRHSNAYWRKRILNYCRTVILQQLINIKSKALYDFLSRLFYRDLSNRLTNNVDVLYTPTTVLFPLNYHKGLPTVLSLHDVQHCHFPEFFDPVELKSRHITYTLSAEKATYLQASSLFIKKDLLQQFPCLKEEQIVLIPEGVDIDLFRKVRGNSDYIIEKYCLPEYFLFFPAQLWPHKDHLTVLKAILKLKAGKELQIPLVLTGAKYSAAGYIFDFINENNLKNQVFHLGKVPYEDIVALYHHARFLITASLHESSCLTVLEAAASGTPIIASDIPPNIELQEHLQLNIFVQQDEAALAELLHKIWNDDNLQKQQVAHNDRNIERYSWENIAKQYIRFFETM